MRIHPADIGVVAGAFTTGAILVTAAIPGDFWHNVVIGAFIVGLVCLPLGLYFLWARKYVLKIEI